MSLISIVVPFYNVEKYFDECLKSIQNQTYKNFEAILVDDGSSDNSCNIAQKYVNSDDRFKIINSNHKGAGGARNEGLKKAKGEFIQFLDSDDYFEPNMLELLIKTAQLNNSDLVICSSKKVDNHKNIIEAKNPNSPINLYITPFNKTFKASDFPSDIFSMLTPVPWNKLIKKSLILDNNIEFPSLKIAEDVSFNYSLYVSAEKIFVIKDELINYRYNHSQATALYRGNYTIDIVKSYLLMKDFLLKKGLYEQYKKALIGAYKNHIRWESDFCSEKNYKNFVSEMKNLLKEEYVIFEPALKKDYLTADFLARYIGNRKVILWGASFFIQNLLKGTNIENIIGIIDKNEALQGKKIGNYKIYPPEILNEIETDGVIMTIYSNWEQMYPKIAQEMELKYKNIPLLENIFEL